MRRAAHVIGAGPVISRLAARLRGAVTPRLFGAVVPNFVGAELPRQVGLLPAITFLRGAPVVSMLPRDRLPARRRNRHGLLLARHRFGLHRRRGRLGVGRRRLAGFAHLGCAGPRPRQRRGDDIAAVLGRGPRQVFFRNDGDRRRLSGLRRLQWLAAGLASASASRAIAPVSLAAVFALWAYARPLPAPPSRVRPLGFLLGLVLRQRRALERRARLLEAAVMRQHRSCSRRSPWRNRRSVPPTRPR